MPRYAVKIGEIELRSDHPITEEERKRAIEHVRRNNAGTVTEDGLFIVPVVGR